MKNLQGRTVKRENAYEVWQSKDGKWTWYVLKKYQVDDNKLYARWFCEVISPFTPQGELGDCYVTDVKTNSERIK